MNKLEAREALVGKTIRWVGEAQYGRDLVIVFDDNDWCLLVPRDCSCCDSHVRIDQCGHNPFTADIRSHLSPDDLLEADLLTPAQRDYLAQQQAEAEAARLRATANELLDKANRLEAETRP